MSGPITTPGSLTTTTTKYHPNEIVKVQWVSQDGMQVIKDIVQIYKNYNYTTQVLAASLRHPMHVVNAALAGAHVGTLPAKVLKQMLDHPLTDAGAEKFRKDWESRPEFGEWLRDLTEKRLAAKA